MKNPVMTIDYHTLSDEDAANNFKDEVVLYTPCETDEDNLILITPEKKQDLINKYNALSTSAKSNLASLSIEGGYIALDRYLFLTK
jgi:hypothetical protein